MLKEIRKYTLMDTFLKIVLVFFIILFSSLIQGCKERPFSFIVIGDTRTEPYLPGGQYQEEIMKTILQKRYNKNPVHLFFDQNALELERVEIPEDGNSTLNLYYNNGWPHSIVRTSHNGLSRVIMRETGRKWVLDRIVSAIRKGPQTPEGSALFLIHGGDIPLFGHQGMSLDESPYWQLFDKELLSRLPPPDKDLGLPGRIFATVGNHEIWEDENISGMLTTMPWLKELGLSSDHRRYSMSFRNCYFIFLDSCDFNTPEDRTGQFTPFTKQMDYLKTELNKARGSGVDHVFIVYHSPSFVKVGHDPLPEGRNPHKYLKPFAGDLNIIVFNSHTHTTEHYMVDGIRYLVLGGGGAPQKFDPTANPSQEEELYWKGEERVEEYNYLQVDVTGPYIRGVIHRFRPTEPQKPISTVEVFRKQSH